MLGNQLISEPLGWFSGVRRGRRFWLLAGATLLAAALVVSATRSITAGAEREGDHQVAGAGKTIIEGGTGAPAYIPVTTVLAFHASGQSGQFEVNAMYVTGTVSSVQVSGGTAVLKGTATVTGLGAGPSQAFTFTVKAGGPGATATLVISGLTFHEILLEGQVTIH
jgi:hypothetical protein